MVRRTLWISFATVALAACGFGDNGVRAGNGPDASIGTDAGIDDPDAPKPPADGQDNACTIVPQGGCATGDACDFGSPPTGPYECRDVTANGTADSLCSSETACAAGFTCITSDGKSWCNRFCESDNQCGANSRCVGEIVSGGQVLAERVCSNACNALSQTGCPGTLGCLPFDDGTRDFTDCRPMGSKLDGQTCADDGECLPGSVCVNISGTGPQCRELCDRSNPSSCSSFACDAFSAELQIGGVNFGFCRL